MRYIKKGQEPKSWMAHKSTPNATYYGANTDKLRLALIKEQGYLCGYCMRRISVDVGAVTTTRIEHIKCQKVSGREDTSRSLDYNNMILCCDGAENLGEKNHQCDVLKRDDDLTFSPLNTNITSLFSYTGDGRMKAYEKEIQTQIGSDTNEKEKGILNLNNFNLKRARKEVLSVLHAYLDKKGWTTSVLKQTKKEWFELDKEGKYKEFSQVVLYFLDKKIRQLPR
ncbi:MAG: hypothetical protein H7319_07455 [Spirosoma sp.]|nr:hypothetical protein [Spirosoma sp.]